MDAYYYKLQAEEYMTFANPGVVNTDKWIFLIVSPSLKRGIL